MQALVMICVLVFAHTTETILGFGATVIAFGLGAHIYPVSTLLVMLVLLALAQNLWLFARWFRHIEWRLVLTRIGPAVLPGVALGMLLRSRADETLLKTILGIFIICVSVMDLVLLAAPEKREPRRLPAPAGIAVLFAGGIFHGLFATGGPLIVYYAGKVFASQESMRGTLSFVWIVLNSIILTGLIAAGAVTVEAMRSTALLAPGLIAGIAIGSAIRVKDNHFKVFTYVMLLFIGIALVVR
ncbi:MAG: sulfite exporter TauE/SafE family protein [Spirochaetes bacterium]|nr:MAG: sulfite exporter TauE/SafE family protein [Spirochaetota bacterium]